MKRRKAGGAVAQVLRIFGRWAIGTSVVVHHRDEPAVSVLVVNEFAPRPGRLIVGSSRCRDRFQPPLDLATRGTFMKPEYVEAVEKLPSTDSGWWYPSGWARPGEHGGRVS